MVVSAHLCPYGRRVASRRIKVQFSDTTLRAIEREAQDAGESTAEFIRAAAFARAVFRYHARGAPGSAELGELYDCALEFDRRHPPGG